MKYVRPVAVIIVMLFTISFASAVGLGLGIKLGYNRANFYGDSPALEESSAKGGLCVGVFKSTSILGLVAIQPELLYTQKGSIAEGDYQVLVTKGNVTYMDSKIHSYGSLKSRSQMFLFSDDEDVEYPGYVKYTAALNPDCSASVYQEVITDEPAAGVVLNVSEGLIAMTIEFIFLLILGIFIFSKIELL